MTQAERALEYLFSRLQEGSTWRAIFILGGGSFALVDPMRAESYMTMAMIGAGLIGIILPDLIKSKE